MDEILTVSLLGRDVSAYGLWVALGAACAALLASLLCKIKRLPAGTAPLFTVLAVPLGLIGSRVLFCLLDFRFHDLFSLRAALTFWGGGYSMVGALLGAALAAALTARILGAERLDVLDAVSPALLVFIACERLGEGCTELLGRSRSLTWDALAHSFLAAYDGYDGYLKTYLLEAATAVVLCGLLIGLLLRRPKSGHVLLIGMLLLGCCQVFWESLRFDSHMRFSFISMQMGIAALLFAIPLIIFAARCGKKPLIITVIVIALVVGGVVGIELMIDRTDVSNVLLYAAYVILLSVPVILGFCWKRRSFRP